MNPNEKASLLYSPDPELERIYNKAYLRGLALRDPINVYQENTKEWHAYEAGYEEGWLDS